MLTTRRAAGQASDNEASLCRTNSGAVAIDEVMVVDLNRNQGGNV
jgi:hypothetical protein